MYVKEVADFLEVPDQYVRLLADHGVLKSQRRSNGYRVFDRDDVEKNHREAIDWLNKHLDQHGPSRFPKKRAKAVMEAKALITGEEACSILEVSRETLRRWEKAGRVQSVKRGKRRMFHRESIDKIAQAEGVQA